MCRDHYRGVWGLIFLKPFSEINNKKKCFLRSAVLIPGNGQTFLASPELMIGECFAAECGFDSRGDPTVFSIAGVDNGESVGTNVISGHHF